MENLTEEQLRFLALGIAKVAVLGGFVGAMLYQLFMGVINAFAEYFATQSLKAARIRAARARATAASVAVAAPVASESVNPLGFYCPENGLYHAWDGDICVTCGAHAPSESLR